MMEETAAKMTAKTQVTRDSEKTMTTYSTATANIL